MSTCTVILILVNLKFFRTLASNLEFKNKKDRNTGKTNIEFRTFLPVPNCLFKVAISLNRLPNVTPSQTYCPSPS